MIETSIKIIEILLYVSIILFPISTFLIIRVVKKENIKIVKEAVTNPVIPNMNLNFFSKLRNEYIRISGKSALPNVNKISFYCMVISIIIFFILVVINEATNY